LTTAHAADRTPLLLLFDIDGTLLSGASRAHATALRQALHNIYGVDADALSHHSAPGAAAGRTDGEIARLMLLDAGISADRIDENAEAVRDECCRLYTSLCPPDLSALLVPGIAPVLASLAGRDDVQLSLVTGNYESVARLKLMRAGIGHWFAPGQGGFGSDSEDRTMLPPIARRRAGQRGTSWPRDHTVVIGDTVRDIACARADGVRCVAVTSGTQDANQLAGADLVTQSAEGLLAALTELAASGR
jgi:phosphoglycolate phosphatase